MRRQQFLIAIILLLAIYLAISRFTEVQQVVETLQRGQIIWLVLAVLVQLLWLANLARQYQATYRLLGMEVTLLHLLPLVVISNFVNVAAPSGGVGGIAVFVADARRRHLSTARVTIAGVLLVLFEYFGYLCILAVGFWVLLRYNHLTAADIGASLVLLLTSLALAGLLALGVRSAQALERVLVMAARAVNYVVRPFIGRDYLSEARAHTFATEAAEGLSALRTGWRDYLQPAGISLIGKGLLISILYLTFLAFDQPVSADTLIGGFSIGSLFVIVSPTPYGLGIVEGVMTLALKSLGVPLEAATVITLAYRGVTFWLPFGYGFVALRVLHWQWR
jgi:glycosyltransferase 2 family protein